MQKFSSLVKRLWIGLLAFAPGIFCIGYTIGTGSVTTMATSGSWFGMKLWWNLLLACIFTGALMEASGRFGVVTGQTTIYSFKTQFKYGPFLAVLVIVGVVVGQWSSYAGIVAISSNGIYETIRLFIPTLPMDNYWAVLIISCVILIMMYALLMVGKYTFFEKVLLFFVTLMGVAFLISLFITIPESGVSGRIIFGGLIPNIPEVPGEITNNLKGSNIYIHLAAFVGTTMAAPTFVVRPLLMKGHGWRRENLKEEQKDALVSVILIFVMSSAIMITSAIVLNSEGKFIQRVLEMVEPLTPVLGRFALSIFMVGLISAGMSSTFPIMMVAALLIADYEEGKLDTNSTRFRVLAAIACLFGLTVPILGFQPIFAQLITQVLNVFVLPLVVAGFIYLVNRKELMGEYKAGTILNLGLIGALVFSLVIAAVGIMALNDTIKSIW